MRQVKVLCHGEPVKEIDLENERAVVTVFRGHLYNYYRLNEINFLLKRRKIGHIKQ